MKNTPATPEKEALALAKRFFRMGREVEAIPARYQQAVKELLVRIEYLEAVPPAMTRSQALNSSFELRVMIGKLGSVMEAFPESIFHQLDKLLTSAKTHQTLEDKLQQKLAKVELLFAEARRLLDLDTE